MFKNKKVSMIGSGNMGTTVAKLIGQNNPEMKIQMYVYEEEINGKKLTEIINTEHENVKYLPGIKIPKNIIANPSLADVTKDSDFLIFCLPHKFLGFIMKQMKPHIKKDAVAISLIKGFQIPTVKDEKTGKETKKIKIISDWISSVLEIPCCCMMGANVAKEIAADKFAESTISYLDCEDKAQNAKNKEFAEGFHKLMNQPNFKTRVTSDIYGTQICGALKNIVALGCGFGDGLDLGNNTKAAIIRIGLNEMIKFSKMFFTGVKSETFFESCGVADLITTCYAGRNRKCGEAFVKAKTKDILEIEKEVLNGMKLEGLATSDEVHEYLEERNKVDEFPLFKAVYLISHKKAEPKSIIEL